MPDSKTFASDSKKNRKDGPALQVKDGEVQRDVTRALPSAIDAEKSILSCMCSDPVTYVSAALENRLTTYHFYVPAHRKLFTTIVNFYEQTKPVEIITFIQALDDQGDLDAVGGHAGVNEIFYYASTSAHFFHHLELVKSKYTLRSMIDTCTGAITRAFEDPANVATLLDSVEQEVLQIREGADTEESVTVPDAIDEVIDNLQKYIEGDRGSQGLTTGYPKLDSMSGGFKPGDMFIIAARPAMGKTSFVMNLVENIVIDQGKAGMVFSLEMSTQQLVQRLLFSRARFSYSNIQKGFNPTKQDIKKIITASEEIRNAKIYIDDTPSISISELRAKARRKHREEGLSVIAIDYLQLMRSNSRQADNSREREVAEISAGLKGLAKELGVPILVLAQLNRGPENRGGTPRMSDLRESGSIEQDADMIGLLYRTAYYAETDEQREEEEGKAELVISKNRHGETGKVMLTFIAELMRFETRADEEGE